MNSNVYQDVTRKIVQSLERGVKPWVCPWNDEAPLILPANYVTRKPYQGTNVLVLWQHGQERGFSSRYWLTYLQAKTLNGHVRRSEKGVKVLIFKSREDEDGQTMTYSSSATVYNADQIDGVDFESDAEEQTQCCSNGAAEILLRRSQAKIVLQGHHAFYRPSQDVIFLPERSRFERDCDYYATALHELVHWSGAQSRLDRPIRGKFGSAEYAYEELIAELGCAFLMADLGVAGDVQHESYLAHWLSCLKEDKTYLFKAVNQASKAHHFLMSFVS
ncbi:ArdC family protein [Vibrio nigripulchritudo]|uniref:ArdC family protein n=1 Tax=Vibrio nigripulchritudo TaxID=28173 RepID=UPI00248F7A78|nr:zincin-like metallopeptidase domain-containing protein [Vibrio nigripulchritudo]BDU41134.1 hypothetical protein TUMSATVNIG2_56030 [Vibrio nigripulchritudo]BDU46874.1 hypothetical protein TUMSATVNIG3_56720 [Vibrio nigripulchritudo]